MLMLKGDVAITCTLSGGPSGAVKIENQLPWDYWVSLCCNIIIEKAMRKI